MFQYQIIYSVYLIIILVIAVPANCLTLHALLKHRHNQYQRIWIIIINFPISHLIQLLIGFPLPIISGFEGRWVFQNIGIYYYGVITGLCGFVTIYTHLLLSFEKYYSMKICFERNSSLKETTLKKFSIGCWLFSFVLVFLPVCGWSTYQLEPLGTYSGVDWRRNGKSLSYVATLLIVGFIFPQLSIAILNVFFLNAANGVQSLERGAYRILRRYTLLSLLSFNVCWGMYATCGIVTLFFNINVPDIIFTLAATVAKLSSIADTLIFLRVTKTGCHAIKRLGKQRNQFELVERQKERVFLQTENS